MRFQVLILCAIAAGHPRLGSWKYRDLGPGGGGFKYSNYFLFSPPGKSSNCDVRIFFRWVETRPPTDPWIRTTHCGFQTFLDMRRIVDRGKKGVEKGLKGYKLAHRHGKKGEKGYKL